MENPANAGFASLIAGRRCRGGADWFAPPSLFAVLQGWLYVTLPAFVGDVTR